MVLDPIPQSLPVHFFGSRPQPPTSPAASAYRHDVSVLQCVAVRGSVLQCVAVCCSVLQCVAVCCSVLQCVAMCCSVLQCVAVCCNVLQCAAMRCSVLQCVAVCCSVLRCVAVCCRVLQCTAYSSIAELQRTPMIYHNNSRRVQQLPALAYHVISQTSAISSLHVINCQ